MNKVKPLRRIYKSQSGIALMLTLWVMVFLTIIVTQFAMSVKTEIKVVDNYVKEAQSYYAAKAGVALALAEIMNPDNEYSYIDQEGKLLFARPGKNNDLGAEEKPGINPSKEGFKFTNSLITYTIEDEGGKIPINAIATLAERAKLVKVFEQFAGMKEGVDRDTVVDSIIDWVDKDDLHQMNGVESDYYNGLDPPYDCKNGPFDILEEMLLVKGMNKKILKKIAPYVTVFSNSVPNESTATCEVWKLWNTSPTVVSTDDNSICTSRFGEDGRPKNKKLSSVYSVISEGSSEDGTVKRTIKCVIKKLGAENQTTNKAKTKMSVKYVYWDDNYIKPQDEEKEE